MAAIEIDVDSIHVRDGYTVEVTNNTHSMLCFNEEDESEDKDENQDEDEDDDDDDDDTDDDDDDDA